MAAHVEILTVVLCSGFLLQDAFSAVGPVVIDGGGVSVYSEDPVPDDPSPSGSRYPNLEKVADMFWTTLENVNKKNEYGMQTMRTARNAFETMMNSQELWPTESTTEKKRDKVEGIDKKRADSIIGLMNGVKELVTNPAVTDGIAVVTNEVASKFDPDACSEVLEEVTNMVNSGNVNAGVIAFTNIVNSVDLNPEKLSKLFYIFKHLLNVGGKTVFDPKSKVVQSFIKAVGRLSSSKT